MIEVLGSNEENKLPIYKYSGKTSFLDNNLFFCDTENDLKKCNFTNLMYKIVLKKIKRATQFIGLI